MNGKDPEAGYRRGGGESQETQGIMVTYYGHLILKQIKNGFLPWYAECSVFGFSR